MAIRTHQRHYPPAKFVFAETGRTGRASIRWFLPAAHFRGSVQNCVLSPDVRGEFLLGKSRIAFCSRT